MKDPFTYRPPNEKTAPLHKLIREAESDAADAFHAMWSWRDAHPDADAQDAYGEINRVTHDLYDVIEATAPGCADKAAAQRCVRLARMAANEGLHSGEARRQALDNLRAARWQACAAIALADD